MVLNAESALQFFPQGLGKFGAKAQCGIDLSVTNITKIVGGILYQDNSKEIKKYESVPYEIINGIKTWTISKGVYSLTFEQEIKLDNSHSGIVVGRSTTNRLGIIIRSGWFDPGFNSIAGATMYVFNDDIKIQEGVRLGQMIIFETQPSEEYKGNYQGEKDLK